MVGQPVSDGRLGGGSAADLRPPEAGAATGGRRLAGLPVTRRRPLLAGACHREIARFFEFENLISQISMKMSKWHERI